MSPAHPLRRRATAVLLAALFTGLLAGLSGAAVAADTPAPSAADPLAAVRAQIANQRWGTAIEELKRLNDSNSADWNNLMGYALRKNQPPDYAAAERHYDAALRINPQHRGALEYSGELYLLTGNLPRAEARLAALDKACTLPCEEYKDLKQAIARYKAKP
jgi:Flp pilus assembly protein TadD